MFLLFFVTVWQTWNQPHVHKQLNKNQQSKKPPCLSWIQVNIRLRAASWEPHTAHIQAYKSGFMIHKQFVEKHGFIWPWISSCKLAFTTYTDRFVIVPDRAEAQRVTKAWPQNRLYMSSISKRKATSHFWHLCFKASPLLKLYLTYCMGVNPSYFLIWKKTHKMLCKTMMKGCVWSQGHASSRAHQALELRIMWDFAVPLSRHMWTPWPQT